MKIAIPTNDCLMIAPVFETSDEFLILTIMLGEIVEEEIRQRQEPGKIDPDQIFPQLLDCSLIVVREISESSAQYFRSKSIRIMRTEEEIITSIVVHYLEHEYRDASNTCCCP
jgi:predicted Fe-Mo cluster-binding NifX family protein